VCILLLATKASVGHGGYTKGALKLIGELPKEKLVYPFSHADRTHWHYIPKDRTGTSYKAMKNIAQRAKSDNFIRSWLSESGWRKLKQIVALESVLGGGLFSSYDPDRYFFAFFGNPGKGPWTFRFEGHHLSLNFTSTDSGPVSFTPFFWGANPAIHTEGNQTIEPLREEQAFARQLRLSLSKDQRKKAIFSEDPLSEVVLVPGERLKVLHPNGITYTELNTTQRKILLDLIGVYLNNFEASLRKSYAAPILKAPEQLHFAWAGGTQPGQGHYYRIQGKDFVVEYDNTQNGANHVHTVWHDLKNNFGRDVLKSHYLEKHKR